MRCYSVSPPPRLPPLVRGPCLGTRAALCSAHHPLQAGDPCLQQTKLLHVSLTQGVRGSVKMALPVFHPHGDSPFSGRLVPLEWGL